MWSYSSNLNDTSNNVCDWSFSNDGDDNDDDKRWVVMVFTDNGNLNNNADSVCH